MSSLSVFFANKENKNYYDKRSLIKHYKQIKLRFKIVFKKINIWFLEIRAY